MPARPLAALSATVAATALAATALVGTAPAQAQTPGQSAAQSAAQSGSPAKPSSLKTTYSCEASLLGAQDVGVTIKLDLPAKVKKGAKVGSRPVKMTVVLPASLVDPLRDLLMVDELSGEATAIKYAVGAKKIPLKGVKLAPTAVPDSGPMTLQAKGVAGGFKAPSKPGTAAVKVPSTFTFTARDGDGNVIGGSGFPCSVGDGAPTKLGSIKVTK